METDLEQGANTVLNGAVANPETWWKPGFCPNPKGRGKNSKSRLQRLLNQALRKRMVNYKGRSTPAAVALIETAIDEAIAGNSKFAKIIFDAGIPKPEVNRNVTINNVLSHIDSNARIDEARLIAPIESRGDAHLLDEPTPQLPPTLTQPEGNNEQ